MCLYRVFFLTSSYKGKRLISAFGTMSFMQLLSTVFFQGSGGASGIEARNFLVQAGLASLRVEAFCCLSFTRKVSTTDIRRGISSDAILGLCLLYGKDKGRLITCLFIVSSFPSCGPI